MTRLRRTIAGSVTPWLIASALLMSFTFISAHVGLTFPPARKFDLDFLDNIRTKPPCGMPKGVVGCIDCTHVQINSPGGNDAELFRNRKQTFSLNVQAVCDPNLNFTNVIARWYGSAHDMRIFEDSNLSFDLEMGKAPGILLGDSGYACLPYLMTPISSPVTPSEHRYNKAQLSTRNMIERAFGVWKRRFPCLTYSRLKVPTLMIVIVATAVLHNIARRRIDIFQHDEPGTCSRNEENVLPVYQSTITGRAKRHEIVQTAFLN